ncbi:VanZ family protein [Ruminococcus flavefaciens]|uniref:VanZ family protein n=1 Tax=Ruminococcus flavefaciens TaxID=1265 RepID=UPI000463F45D
MRRALELQRKQVHIILLISTVVLILFFTFIVRETLEIRHVGSRGVCLTPFRELKGLFTATNHWFYFWQIFLNILLFIPFGFMLSCNLYIQRRPNKLWLPILLSGLLVSISVEFLQYLSSRGYTEIDDVINNSLGAMFGWFLYDRMLKAARSKKKI